MDVITDAAYLFRRSRDETLKADEARARGDAVCVIAAHNELALRYKVRALSLSSGAVPCIDATGRRSA